LFWDELNDEGKFQVIPLINDLTRRLFKEIKGPNINLMNGKISWVEFKGYRSMLSTVKENIENKMQEILVMQRQLW
jgi:hypothetical protein